MNADSTAARLRELTAQAARRLRGERTRRWALAASCIASTLLALWGGAALLWPGVAGFSAVFVGACLLGVATICAVAWFLPLPSNHIARALDRERSLPDSAVSAHELAEGEVPESWRTRQLEDTVRRAEEAVPRRGGRFDWALALGVASALVLGISVLFLNVRTAAAEPVDPVLAQHGVDLEELFQDWELAQRESPDPQLEELLKEVEPLREMLAEGRLDQREMFVQLSRIEDRIAAMQEKMARESLDPHAAELADSMNGVQGMEPLAAALRAGDYEKARQAADQLGEKLNKPDATTPQGAQQAADRMASAADRMQQEGQKSMAQGMQNLSQGAKQNNPSKMAQGLQKISQCMGQQAAQKKQRQGMSLCRQQMGMAKQCMGNRESMCNGLSLIPKLSMQKGKGGGAGSEIDLQREKPETDSLGAGTREHLTGVADAMGESETQTVSASEAPTQQTTSVATADFAEYRKLSEEAIEDESLPLAHRLTIRRYFESIRPTSENTLDEPR